MEEQIAERMEIEYERNEYSLLSIFRLSLLSMPKRIIPKSLIYIGNFAGAAKPKREFVPKDCDNDA